MYPAINAVDQTQTIVYPVLMVKDFHPLVRVLILVPPTAIKDQSKEVISILLFVSAIIAQIIAVTVTHSINVFHAKITTFTQSVRMNA